jgi:hypothetical protein
MEKRRYDTRMSNLGLEETATMAYLDRVDARLDELQGKTHFAFDISNFSELMSSLDELEARLENFGREKTAAEKPVVSPVVSSHIIPLLAKLWESSTIIRPVEEWIDRNLMDRIARYLFPDSWLKQASGGVGMVSRPTHFLAGEAGREAYAFVPGGTPQQALALATGYGGGVTYVDNRHFVIGSWLGDRRGIEELADRLQPVFRNRERIAKGQATY